MRFRHIIFSIADVGFSQHFIREAGIGRSDGVLKVLKEELISAKRFYLYLEFHGIIVLLTINKIVVGSLCKIYPVQVY